MSSAVAGALHDKITEVSLSSGNLPSSMAGSTYVFEFDDVSGLSAYYLCDQNGRSIGNSQLS